MADGYPSGRHSAGAIPWLALGALCIVAVFGIAGAVLLTGNRSPAGPPSHHKPQALAAASPPTASTPGESASPSPTARKPAPKKTHSASASPPPSATPPPPSATPQPTKKPKPKPPPTVQLTAALNVWSHHSDGSGAVFFQVNDTGSAAAGQVTVAITLPAGASMSSGGGGEAPQNPSDGNSGWNCQATSAGATCTYAGLAAGSQSWGTIDFTTGGSSVCGEAVDLTASSGSASASAQSTVGC